MIMEVTQTDVEVVRFRGVLNGQVKQVDEPNQRVLVHGFDVGQICYGEEENGAVDGDPRVTHPRLVNLLLSLLGH